MSFSRIGGLGTNSFSLGRVIWNVVDVVVAIGLVYLVVMAFRKKIS